jgi:hypothetical protein
MTVNFLLGTTKDGRKQNNTFKLKKIANPGTYTQRREILFRDEGKIKIVSDKGELKKSVSRGLTLKSKEPDMVTHVCSLSYLAWLRQEDCLSLVVRLPSPKKEKEREIDKGSPLNRKKTVKENL